MTNEYGRFVSTVNGSESTYICDYQAYAGSGTYVARVGGYCYSGAYC